MRRAVLALPLAALCWLAPQAAGASRLAYVETLPSYPFDDGERLLWNTPGGRVMTLDGATGRRRAFALPAGCGLAGATRGGVGLVRCRRQPHRRLDTRTGALDDLPRIPPVDLVGGVGRFWLYTLVLDECYPHDCGYSRYLNWRTGEERRVEWMDDNEQFDLDSPGLRELPLDTVAVAGRSLLEIEWNRRGGAHEVLRLRGPDGRRRRIARCRDFCHSAALWPDRVAWIETTEDEAGRRTLHRLSLRTGRRRQTPLGSRLAGVVRAGPTLFVLRPAGEPRQRLYRLEAG